MANDAKMKETSQQKRNMRGHTGTRRNSTLEKIYVEDKSSLSKAENLSAQALQMQENRYNVFVHNLEFSLSKLGISQAEFCAKWLENTLSSPQLTSFKQVGKVIPFPAMCRISAALGLTVEEMTGTIIGEEDHTRLNTLNSYRKYIGTFGIAYFDRNRSVKANNSVSTDTINYGVVSIYYDENDKQNNYKVVGVMDSTDRKIWESFDSLVSEAVSENDGDAIASRYSRKFESLKNDTPGFEKSNVYSGKLITDEKIIELHLKCNFTDEVIRVFFNNRDDKSTAGGEYLGGMAETLFQIDAAQDTLCTERAIISRFGFSDWATEKIVAGLLFASASDSYSVEAETISSFCKDLYGKGHEFFKTLSGVSEAEKSILCRIMIEQQLREAVARCSISGDIILKSDDYKICEDISVIARKRKKFTY